MRLSKWERFPEALAQAARYQSQRLYRYLDRALDSRLAINLRSQFGTVRQDDGIGAWTALLRWNDIQTDPERERDAAMDTYYNTKLEPQEHPESLWTRLNTARDRLIDMNIGMDEGALERRSIKAITQTKEGHLYHHSLRAHQLEQRKGKSSSTKDLRIVLTFAYEEAQLAERVRNSRTYNTRTAVRPAVVRLHRVCWLTWSGRL